MIVILAFSATITLANPLEQNSISKGPAIKSENFSTEDYNSFRFANVDIFTPSSKGPCGWASSPSACSNACYHLGWPFYTYWFATGDCCCS